MAESGHVSRRGFMSRSLAAAGALGVAAAADGPQRAQAAPAPAGAEAKPAAGAGGLPCGTIGKARISRMLLGGNLIGGFMHSRDLLYVNQLFRAYVRDEKILETMKLAEENGINTVFETGAEHVKRYNREFGGHMQFIPHIQVNEGQKEGELEDHIQKQVDSGAVALYVWGVAGDTLMKAGRLDLIARAVELAKAHDLPVGVGSHSLLVPMACEKEKVPCDFYVKTFHRDDYPSATPKELRKEFIWIDGGKGWYDNMWCINPEETAAFMKTVTKPWIAFKVLAAGGIQPREGFTHAFDNGADFIAVGMFDFQVKEDCDLARAAVAKAQNRPRPWRA
ncbi:MAG: hypothetical protein IMZ66_05415 [Planctomycetes bacterium]|nr:hypothetical protein [Planctomycetota bacterium]